METTQILILVLLVAVICTASIIYYSLSRISNSIDKQTRSNLSVAESILGRSDQDQDIAQSFRAQSDDAREFTSFLKFQSDSISRLEKPFTRQSESLENVSSGLHLLIESIENLSSSMSKQSDFLTNLIDSTVGKSKSAIERVDLTSQANFSLTDTPEGRAALLQYFRSEVGVSSILAELEEIAENSDSFENFLKTAKERLELGELEDESPKRLEILYNYFKTGSKYVGKKLFDKANDIVKKTLGGSSKEE